MRTHTSPTPQVGQNIIRLAEERGLSRPELARAAQLSMSGLVQIELGKRGIGLALAWRIARALECSLDELLVDSPPSPRTAARRAGRPRKKGKIA
jgi:transcriptional regulator with XRE-family HTH domain